jgi:non-homologous end joining protein Ku
MDVIEEKVESGGEEIEEKPKPKKESTKVIDLVAVLKESLEKSRGVKKKKRAPKRATKHHAKKAA